MQQSVRQLACQKLNDVLREVGLPHSASIDGDDIILPAAAVRGITAYIAFTEGGHHAPLIRAILTGAAPTEVGVRLEGDTATHISNALREVAASRTTRAYLSRGATHKAV